MPRKLIQRFMPSEQTLREHPSLKYLAHHIHPNLWHLNQRSVAVAVAVGLFFAFVPLPFHTLLAALAAILLHCNLPISILVLWLNNPLTLLPLYYFAYEIGLHILQLPKQHFHFEFSMEWLITDLELIWEPFLLGCLVCATASAIIGYLGVKVLWHCSVRRRWVLRQRRRQNSIST